MLATWYRLYNIFFFNEDPILKIDIDCLSIQRGKKILKYIIGYGFESGPNLRSIQNPTKVKLVETSDTMTLCKKIFH